MTRLLDLIPEAIDKITKGAVSPEARAAAKDMLDKDDAEDDLLDHIEIVTANED